MTIWEYKTVKRKQDDMLTDEQLNLLGQHGFDLVSAVVMTEDQTIVGRHMTVQIVQYIFKRPKPAAAAAPKPAAPAAAAPPKPG